MEFENPKTILLGIRKRSFWHIPHLNPLYDGKDIKINDSEFDKKFSVRGNKENEIRVILDPSIRNKIMKIKDLRLLMIKN